MNAQSPMKPPNVVAMPKQDWRDTLIVNDKGAPRPILANAVKLLQHHPAFDCLLAFNEFISEPELQNHAPWEREAKRQKMRVWEGDDDLELANFAQQNGIYIKPDVAAQAVQIASKVRKYHPVRDKLSELPWDGQARVDTLFPTYFGAHGASNEYLAEVARTLLVGAVARVFSPGCKLDTMPILEGPQGSFKSTALSILAGPTFFTDEITDIGSKDAGLQLQGKLIVEIAELDAMHRAEIDRLKAWLSRQIDRFRPPYGRRVKEFPRQCVIVGTTNRSDYLRDETGGRRFLPVRCGRIDIDALKRDRYQLWAEATRMYRDGAKWWLTTATADAAEQQGQRYAADPWQPIIEDYLEMLSETSVHQLLKGPLGLEPARQDQSAQNRAARVLVRLGWRRVQVRRAGKSSWVYRPPEDQQA
jgi:predicted P-loop ATPase